MPVRWSDRYCGRTGAGVDRTVQLSPQPVRNAGHAVDVPGDIRFRLRPATLRQVERTERFIAASDGDRSLRLDCYVAMVGTMEGGGEADPLISISQLPDSIAACVLAQK